MEQNNKKILTISFMAAGGLLALVFDVILHAIMPLTSGAAAQVLGSDFVQHVFPVFLGAALFIGLQFNKRVLAWSDDVITELRKIVWPSRRDTTAMTIVVVIMVLISAGVIWVFDLVSAYFVNYLVAF